MSDEQRRTSLRHAGAIEFMAPEQNQGQMLSETDVYSFGVVMFELIAGTVPFPLHDKGETARNRVMVSHMDTTPPDLLELRRQAMPESWPREKKEREMNVPMWLVSMVYRCLEKKPENRFANGMELHEYIVLNSTLYNDKVELTGTDLSILQKENEKLLREKSQLQTKVAQYQQATERREEELELMKEAVNRKEAEISELRSAAPAAVYDTVQERERSGVSKATFYGLLVLTICLAAFAAYSLFSRNSGTVKSTLGTDSTLITDTVGVQNVGEPKVDEEDNTAINSALEKTRQQKADSIKQAQLQQKRDLLASRGGQQDKVTDSTAETTDDTEQTDGNNTGANTATDDAGKQYYTVISRAYFHNKPDPETKREGVYITHWNNAKLTALEETNDFIYVVFKNHLGQTSKGWLRKSDLKLVGG
jgi:serine/threonine-protein kinase